MVATGTGGAIVAGNTWTYFKFGDSTKPGVTDVGHVVPRRFPAADRRRDQTTQNNCDAAAGHAHRHDRRTRSGALTSAFRIHNGAATGASDARRIEAHASGGTDVWSSPAPRTTGWPRATA